MAYVKRLLLFLISLTFFTLLLIYISPPKSWPEATVIQILIFFIPFLVTATFFANIFLHSITHSFIFGLGVMILAALQALKVLNFLSGPVVIVITFFAIKHFPKVRFRLTFRRKIPKLTRLGEK